MTVSYAVRVDEKIRDAAAEVAKSYGLDLATATRAFWTQMARTGSIPLRFSYEEPNDESLASVRDADAIIAEGKPRFSNADEMFKSLGI